MSPLPAAIAMWIAGGLAAWLLRRRPGRAAAVGAGAAVAGAALAALAALRGIAGGEVAVLAAPWSVPFGAIGLKLDALAGAFLLPVCVVGALCAISGAGLRHADRGGGAAGAGFAAYNLLLASMAVVTTATHLVLLLAAWELMTLASYALVVSGHDARAVRRAGFQYLVVSQLAAGALLLLFVMLAHATGSWTIGAPVAPPAGVASAWLLVLALIGFGTKAAIVPFHIWLPDAHTAAPAHVSALMSGVMITMGFYGLARFLPLLGPASEAAACALLALGAAGALGAVLLAVVQRDVKRVLAYSTVENAGLVTLAMGVGLLGQARQEPGIAALGWTAALLHVWTHAIAKALLFGGIGAIAHAAHSRDLEGWGGMLRRWPLLGGLTVLGGFAIAAVPGLSGFVSEWLVLRALFESALVLDGAARVAMVIAIAAVAMTAALTVACYARLLGIGLLGAPRHAAREDAFVPPGPATIAPLAALALLSVGMAWFPAPLAGALAGAVRALAPTADPVTAADAVRPLGGLALVLALVIALFGALRAWLVGRRPVRATVTWDCGYARPDARMQYTGASLAEPIGRLFAAVLRTRIERHGPRGYWPAAASWHARTVDRTMTGVYRPALGGLSALLLRLRDLQEPRVTTYLRYLVVALLIVLGLLFLPIVVRP
jgi:formate hydrogenlyase subunit 3/multisubunit Na+/H+ antiporter MnhD subunit